MRKAKRECNHKPHNKGYREFFVWADDLAKKGIEQTQCSMCKLWFFPDERPQPQAAEKEQGK